MSNMMDVTSLNTKIKSLLEASFMHIVVEGEVASLTYHSSGHLYFSIKDKQSSIKCVMWRSSVQKLRFELKAGLHIVVNGSLGVYTPRGEYQFYAVNIEPFGQGALALAYEQLKTKLQDKGYFDARYKKPLPQYIQKIALVTAKNSAGLYDMLKIIETRWALVEVIIVDTLVQGSGASLQIANALGYADSLGVDVVVVGRGGGSKEDLWAFNEECVADAIFAMKTPVVSAVGHQIDVLISDFVADLRAPTPSASMEMILPDRNEQLYLLNERVREFHNTIHHKIAKENEKVNAQERLFISYSPFVKMENFSKAFTQLKQEYQERYRQKLLLFESATPPLAKEFKRMLYFIVQNKEKELALAKKQALSLDPKLLCLKGWAKISVDKKVVALSSLKEEQKFILEDEKSKIEALFLGKL